MKYKGRLLKWISVIFFIYFALLEAYIPVSENFSNRVRVLYIGGGRGPHHEYSSIEFLERKTNLRFIYQRESNPESKGGSESAQICDGILWDNAEYPIFLEKRIEELRTYLKRKDFDFIVLRGKKLPVDIQKSIVDYVKNGGFVVWLYPDVVEKGFLREICPFKKKKGRRSSSEVILSEIRNPLFCGILCEEMFSNLRFPPVEFGKEVKIIAKTKKENYGVIGIKSYGKGEVMGYSFPQLIPVIHNYGDKNNIDTDFLWAEFWEQIGNWIKWEEKKFPVQINCIPEKKRVIAGERVNLKVEFYIRNARVKRGILELKIIDARGKEFVKKKVKLNKLVNENLKIEIPKYAHTGKYLIAIRFHSGNFIHSAYSVIEVKGYIESFITTEKFGYLPGENINFDVKINSSIAKTFTAEFFILTPFKEIVNYQRKKVALKKGENSVRFNWKMIDYGIEGWAFRSYFLLTEEKGKEWDYTEKWFWRYQPWTMREKILISNYWALQERIPSSLFPLFVLYHKGIGYNAGHSWKEPYYSRFNMRAWYQFSATMMERYTNNFTTKDFSHLKSYAKKMFDVSHHTGAYVIYDFGEETGFYYHWSNNPFGRKWKKEKDIPPGAHRFFRMYLKEKYGTIEKLNEEWETNYRSFDEIKLSPEYGYPSGWLFLPPPKHLPENIAPYIDTHGFFFWYVKKVAETITNEIKKYNPTPDWGMSFSLTFNLFSPIPMTMIHPCYNSQILVPWNNKAIRFSKEESTPLFSFHWGFSPDFRVWGQFWNQSLASLSTFISNWGPQFNPDLTHSRSTFYLKKLMRKVRKREKFFLDCYPVKNFDVGFYHPDLEWQEVHSHPSFYLKAQGPESKIMGQLGYKPTGTGWMGGPHYQIYNALNSSGYVVRYVDEEEIEKCRVLVVPYVECLSEYAAEKIKNFVKKGGVLITFPVIGKYDEYGKPYREYPGAGLSEVIGLKANPDIIGKRSILVLKGKKNFPLEFTPRSGSEPPYLWTFGHQKILSKGKNVEVIATHYDGNPAITVNQYGKGKAIHFNMFIFD
ncbi:beta-galactosidase trimerization domain-containing protein, partial [bacterium]|nr:beta-galactosidase trimerization domain-containing protein [bacterium]